MSKISIGELKSNLLTELDASDTEKIVGGTSYISHNYFHGYHGGKFFFDFKKFDLKGLLDKIYGGFKKGKKKGYSYSSVYKNGKLIYESSKEW